MVLEAVASIVPAMKIAVIVDPAAGTIAVVGVEETFAVTIVLDPNVVTLSRRRPKSMCRCTRKSTVRSPWHVKSRPLVGPTRCSTSLA
jgi:hypothetical protein